MYIWLTTVGFRSRLPPHRVPCWEKNRCATSRNTRVISECEAVWGWACVSMVTVRDLEPRKFTNFRLSLSTSRKYLLGISIVISLTCRSAGQNCHLNVLILPTYAQGISPFTYSLFGFFHWYFVIFDMLCFNLRNYLLWSDYKWHRVLVCKNAIFFYMLI